MATILFGGGVKGGVGKSFFNRCLVQYFLHKSWDYTLIEADATIPDVRKIYGSSCKVINFSDDPKKSHEPDFIFEEAIKNTVLVNLPSNIFNSFNYWISSTGLLKLKDKYQVEVIKLFVTDGCFESLEIFKESVQKFDGGLPHVLVRNTGRLTAGSSFDYLEEKKDLRELIEKYKVPVYDFPALNSREQYFIDEHSLTLEQATLRDDIFGPLGCQRVVYFLESIYKFFDDVDIIQVAVGSKEKTKIRKGSSPSEAKRKPKSSDKPDDNQQAMELTVADRRGRGAEGLQ